MVRQQNWIDFPQHRTAWYWLAAAFGLLFSLLFWVSLPPDFQTGGVFTRAILTPLPHPTASASVQLSLAKHVSLPHNWDAETPHMEGAYNYRLQWPQPIKMAPAPGSTESPQHSGQPDADDAQGWALLIPRIGARYRVLLNGKIIHSAYWNTPGYVDTSAEPQMIRLPHDLDMSQPHVLDIEVKGHALRKSGLQAVYLAHTPEILERYNLIYWWQVYLTWMVCACSGMLCLMTAMMWWNGRENLFAWLSLASLAWTIRLALTPLVAPPMPFGLWFFLHKVAFTTYCGFLYLFMWDLFQLEQPRARLLVWGLLVLSPVWIVLVWWTAEYDGYRILTGLFALISMVSLGLMIHQARWGANLDQRLMVVIGMVTLITGLRDFLSVQFSILGDADLRWMTPGSLVFLLTLSLIVVQRMSRYVDEIQRFSDELEVKLTIKQAELQEAFDNLRQVELQQVISAERARLTRDMHDGLGSQLVQTLNAVRSERPPSHQDMAQMLGHVLEELRMTLDSMETMEGDLPTILGALRGRIAHSLHAAGIELDWMIDDVPALLGPQGQSFESQSVMHLFRCVQEVFANAIKHAHTQKLQVQTGLDERGVWLSITDHGTGMLASEREGGRGLGNIRARAQAIGAEVSWNPAPHHPSGTEVLFVFPHYVKESGSTPLKVAFTSCNHPIKHPSQPGWLELAAHEPDFLILLGDNTYFEDHWWQIFINRPARALSDDDFARYAHQRYALQWQVPEFQTLLQVLLRKRTRILGTVDDHDFLGNDTMVSDTTVQKAKIARLLFRQFIYACNHLPQQAYPDLPDWRRAADPGMDEGLGVAHSERVGEVQLVILDNRSFREKPGPHAQALGSRQTQWLQQQLLGDQRVTLIFSGSPLTKGTKFLAPGSPLSAYPAEYEVLRALYKEHSAKNIVHIGGDLHYNEYKGKSYHRDFIEVASSGMGTGFQPFSPSEYGNYGIVELRDNELHIQTFGREKRRNVDHRIPV